MQSQFVNIFKNFKPLGENFADIRVVVQGKTYKCHKIILSNVSTFFERLLATDCKETSSGVISLEDVESRIFDIIYNFIYSAGDTTVLKNASILSLLQVLVCADKWFIPCLAGSCTSTLIQRKNWSHEKLFQAFEKAVTLKNSILADHVKQIFRNSRKEYVNSKEVYKMNLTCFKEFLQFSKSLNLTEVQRFKLLAHWIERQDFHSPEMQYSLPDISLPTTNATLEENGDSPIVWDLLAVINKLENSVTDWQDVKKSVEDLLALINYNEMSIADFKSGPGSSKLLSVQSKYDSLCAIAIRCPCSKRQKVSK